MSDAADRLAQLNLDCVALRYALDQEREAHEKTKARARDMCDRIIRIAEIVPKLYASFVNHDRAQASMLITSLIIAVDSPGGDA